MRARGESQAALSEFESAIRLKPDFEKARYNRAVILREEGKREAALAEARSVEQFSKFRKDLAEAKSLTVSASERLKQNDFDGALSDTRAALGLWNENPVAYYLAGLAWSGKGDAVRARMNLEEAVELKDDYAEAHNSLGRVLWEQQNRRRAIEEFDKAIAVVPDFPEAHFNRGLAAAELGEFLRAQSEFREALDLRPDYLEARLSLALTYQQKKDYEAAIQILREALRQQPDAAEVRNNLGLVWLEKGDKQAASEELHQAIRLKPEFAQAHYNLGIVLRQQGDARAAAAEFHRAQNLNPALTPP